MAVGDYEETASHNGRWGMRRKFVAVGDWRTDATTCLFGTVAICRQIVTVGDCGKVMSHTTL